jgi:hypothetical protein
VTFAKLASSWSDGVTRGAVVVMVGVVEGVLPGVMEAVCCKVEVMKKSCGGRARINICFCTSIEGQRPQAAGVLAYVHTMERGRGGPWAAQ